MVATPDAPDSSTLGAGAPSPGRAAAKLSTAKVVNDGIIPAAVPVGGKRRGSKKEAALIPSAVSVVVPAPTASDNLFSIPDLKQMGGGTVADGRGTKADAAASCDRCYASSAMHKAATDKVLRLQTRQSRLLVDMVTNHHKATVCCITNVFKLIFVPSYAFLHR